MVVRGFSPSAQSLTANLQPGALTLAWDIHTVLAYDRAGRLWSAFLDGVTYRRGYHGRIMAKSTLQGQRVRRWLDGEEADRLIARTADLMRLACRAEWETGPETRADLIASLERAAAFTPPVAAQDAHRFHAIYKPIGILPPDQYMALVLQLTEGCSFNTCTFCTFYRDRPFRIKSPAEFRAHLAAVVDYLGPALAMRKGIFLADANALVVPQKRLVELLDVIPTLGGQPPVFEKAGFSRLYAFLDGFSGAKKSPQDYAELAARGLKRVYIGLESGHEALLRFLKKPGTAAEALAAVQAIKAGGVQVCVIILLGVGGTSFANGHICDTIQVVNAMGLTAGDLIYFSEFVEQPGQPYGVMAARAHIAPLSPDQILEQRRAIQSGLRFAGPPPKIAMYDIREFVY